MTQLKLLAVDKQDLEIISGHCQDAVLKVADMSYDRPSKTFSLVLNRFAWEVEGGKERRKSMLRFSRVNGVKLSGIQQTQSDMVVSLLAILFEVGEEPSGTIELVFAGDGAIRLDVECVEVQLSDLPAAWEAKSRPSHE